MFSFNMEYDPYHDNDRILSFFKTPEISNKTPPLPGRYGSIRKTHSYE